MFEETLLKLVKKISKQAELRQPPDPSFGDFSMPCFPLAKERKQNPVQIAEELAKEVKAPDFVAKVEAKGGYLNFFLKEGALAESVITKILKEKEKHGTSQEGKGKTVVMDYSHPNVAKPFGIGHLRSTVIGQCLVNLFQNQGYKVVRLNYLGDWGTPFGKYIEGYRRWGDAKKLAKEPIKHLYEIYVRYNKEAEDDEELQQQARDWFKKLEEGDKEALQLYHKFRDLSLKEFKRIYTILGVEFDSFDGEFSILPKVEATLALLKKKGLSKIDQNALVVPMEPVPLMLKKSDEATTYGARDLASIEYRVKHYKADHMLYVVGNEQTLYFTQVFSVAKKLGYKGTEHIKFGMYLAEGGKKMATRKGTLVLLDKVLEETIQLALNLIKEKNPKLANKEKVAQQVGVGAVIFGDLVNDRVRDIMFDWEKIVQFEGDTGPYLMYSNARANSILTNVKVGKPDFTQLKHAAEVKLVTVLGNYTMMVQNALRERKPHTLAQYLLEVSHRFNEFYHACPVLKADDKEKAARLSLVKATTTVLENGLALLGIAAPKTM
ncbi:MAG: arginine--tRNA ligase [Candidatus Woesearchaeota archaeon]|jgi:arginyl-tRNA synthetase|nr:arginine--tRNA ligase [Candidatus Woesearchaeota archaeon]MDP7198440.1 arginine--tRNA ligase [Candidatus Woesearchaeota archaeon]MDP7466818.1 arginine--tRNA ligase [Candidatus Woesearchaeota archaeon]MDP7648043.1 arginine--tRNA ligase [Candidatus Woesearchaeota archaeon]